MKTKTQIIAELKLQYPTIEIGNDEESQTLAKTDYDKIINGWADNLLAIQAEEEAALKAASDKAALLAKIGITADEATLLLS
jgi:hypothetical protein